MKGNAGGNTMAKLMDLDVDDYLKQCVQLEPEALSEEFGRISADYAYWNEKYANANKAHLMAEWEEEKTEARLRLKFKEPEAGKKPPTEGTVDAAVKLAPEYEAVHLVTLTHQAERDYLKGVLETLRTKREMAISMGAHLRQEAKGDLRIMERNELERAAQRFSGG
jgi:hypothetical protein